MRTFDPRLRILIFRLVLVGAFVVLTVQLWRLQILHVEDYRLQADVNRFRLVSIDAPRGVMYDRRGRLLVRNIPQYTVSLAPGALPEDEGMRNAVLSRLSQLLQIPVSSRVLSTESTQAEMGIEEILAQGATLPFEQVTIKENVDRRVALLIEEERFYLPGVRVEAEPVRQYLANDLMAHIVGYMGAIPPSQMDSYLGEASEDYAMGDAVGLVGVEASYERELRGHKGLKHIEVDGFEREVNVLAIDPPQPGNSLKLTIDLDLQKATESALLRGMANVDSTSAVAIAMDPRNGRILATVSLPSYDNNLFAQGISFEDFQRLCEDETRPLVNHAISGQYPPGSTFKLIPAAAGLETGVLKRNTAVTCRGTMWVPNKFFPNDPSKAQPFRCYVAWGHGSVDVVEALAQSCDVFFYQTGGGFGEFEGLNMDRMGDFARAFGFGEPTGIRLPGEASGLIPDEKWKRLNYGEVWLTGDTYNASIGQGYVLATPLQLLNATAAVANGGTLYRPQIVSQIIDYEGSVVEEVGPEVIRQVPVSDKNLQIVREGMRAAVTRGTAHRAQLAGIAVAGKTGSAEYPGERDEFGILPTHAWFTAFAPYDDPEIVVTVFVSGGHEGSRIATPIGAEMLRAYFGLPPAESIVQPVVRD